MRAGKKVARLGYLVLSWLCVATLGMTVPGCNGSGKGTGLGSGGRGATSLAASGGLSGFGGAGEASGGRQGGQTADTGGLVTSGAQGGAGGLSATLAGGTDSQTSGATGGSVGGGGGAGGASTGDGGVDSVCVPDCWRRMHAGCFPGGSCTYVTGRFCWSNGFKMATGYYDGASGQAFFQNGSLCAIQQFSSNGYTYYDAKGTILGVLRNSSDGSFTVTCTGESTVTVPADCPAFLRGCHSGDCTVP